MALLTTDHTIVSATFTHRQNDPSYPCYPAAEHHCIVPSTHFLSSWGWVGDRTSDYSNLHDFTYPLKCQQLNYHHRNFIYKRSWQNATMTCNEQLEWLSLKSSQFRKLLRSVSERERERERVCDNKILGMIVFVRGRNLCRNDAYCSAMRCVYVCMVQGGLDCWTSRGKVAEVNGKANYTRYCLRLSALSNVKSNYCSLCRDPAINPAFVEAVFQRRPVGIY